MKIRKKVKKKKINNGIKIVKSKITKNKTKK